MLLTATLKCNSCRRSLTLADIVRFGLGSIEDGLQCLECRALMRIADQALFEGHNQALTEMPIGEMRCALCNLTFEEIWKTHRNSVFVHPIDGVRQIVCPPCSDGYAVKEAQGLYKGTKYAWEKKGV